MRNEDNKTIDFGRLQCWYYWLEWFMRYAVEMASAGMIYVLSSKKICSGIHVILRLLPRQCGIFNWPNPPSRTTALGSTQPLTEMSTRNLLGGKGQPTRKADNVTAICEPTVKKMWEFRRLTTLWASKACYLYLLSNSTIWEIVMLVLLMLGIFKQAFDMVSGSMIYIPVFMTIGWSIQVILGLLPQQFQKL
jgi:hypothetical protein